ncbi:SGNH/GDSL hydrolase family protein [Muricauda sp. 334s03]|uniref:SGNH/GDSL hydrolase family protein n=1 Tax=Flagellimonas yonaguniensis TaxID=3031325 RepID=A0ABT5Y1E3_9FLAO|nr:SGNH/GDSL hydrolase family protein [[Muricauda] yonaguniensis]MDF0717272.1 SGNH/GDSL hydrolase family protein [[Muricauda] yonaguniensis]
MKKQTILWIMLSFLGLSITSKVNAQDWPNLEKYKNENTELPAPTESENRVVFMGNSITEMWIGTHPEFFAENPYVNRGIGGQTTPQMLLRFRQDVIDLSPKAVVVLAGTNDIAGNTGPMTLEQIHDNILSMVELAKANGIKPIVCSVLPAYDYPWRPGLQPNIKIPKLNKMLKEMAENEGAMYLDYFSEMADDRNGLPSELTTDEVHVTKAGYEVMERMVKDAIDKTLKNQ